MIVYERTHFLSRNYYGNAVHPLTCAAAGGPFGAVIPACKLMSNLNTGRCRETEPRQSQQTCPRRN